MGAYDFHGTARSAVEFMTKKLEDATANLQAQIDSIKAHIKDLQTITIGSHTNGSLSADNSVAYGSELVTFTATPNEGYGLASVSVTDASGNAVTTTKVSEGVYTFIMPSADVTIAATFSILYTIEVEQPEHITIGVIDDVTSAIAGTRIVIYRPPTILGGWNFEEWNVTCGVAIVNPTLVMGSQTHYEFTMPSGNVTITATESEPVAPPTMD